MKKNKLRVFARILSIVLTVLTIGFAYVYGKGLIERADFSELNNSVELLVLAYVVFALFYVLSSVHWLYICRLIEKDTPSNQAAAFFASQPYKYLPTSIFTFSFRAKFAKQLGLSIKKSSYAQLIENFNILTSGVLVSILFYVLSRSFLYGSLILLMALIVLGIIYKNKTILKLPKVSRTIPAYKLIPCFLLMSIAWVFAGLSFLLASHALGYSPSIFLMIAANAAGYVASILAVFAPGGIGIRELVLKTFSVQDATIILWRLLTFSIDLVLGAIAIIYISIVSRKTPKTS